MIIGYDPSLMICDEYATKEQIINPYVEYVVNFAKNHGISISEAIEHPMCKARLDYFNKTGK